MSAHDMTADDMTADKLPCTVNGKQQHVPAGTTLRALVEQLGMGKQAVAIEVNGALVPHKQHEARIIQSGDSLELVSLVGGG